MKEKASRDFCRGQTFLLTANKKVLVELSWVPSLRRQQNNFPFVWRSGTQSFLKVSSSEEDKKRSDAFEEINLAWRKLRYRHEVWSVRVCVCVFVQLKNAISYAHHVSNFFSFFLHTTRASEVARKMYSRSSTFVEITFRSPFSSFIMNTNTPQIQLCLRNKFDGSSHTQRDDDSNRNLCGETLWPKGGGSFWIWEKVCITLSW